MKFCTKCGNQMEDDMVFCQKCGTKNLTIDSSLGNSKSQDFSAQIHNALPEQNSIKDIQARTGMKVGMILSYIFAGMFAIGSTADVSMFAGVCLFGILGTMFMFLSKMPKGPVRMFSEIECFKKSNGISKGAFVGISIFLSLFLFITIMNISSANSSNKNVANNITDDSVAVEKKEQPKKTPEIPEEFAGDCPITISTSMYDNIIGFPELKCNIRNKIDKEISAIQFYFLPKDVYGEEADGIFAQNKLQTDTTISANGTNTVVWQMLDQSVKSGDLYVYSVYFSDGTEWGDRNAPTSKIKKYAMRVEASY